jgi:hypothetical protein
MKNQSSTFVADANNFTGTINDGDYPWRINIQTYRGNFK